MNLNFESPLRIKIFLLFQQLRERNISIENEFKIVKSGSVTFHNKTERIIIHIKFIPQK